MLLDDIKSGMVINVLSEGEEVKYLVAQINGNLIAFNETSTLGELDYWFDGDLHSMEDEVELLAIYVITSSEVDIFHAINTGDFLSTIWVK